MGGKVRIKLMPCTEGQYHKWPIGWNASPTDRCMRCNEVRVDLYQTCNKTTCGEFFDGVDGRVVERTLGFYEWQHPRYVKHRYIRKEDHGTCNWCLEKHRRHDIEAARKRRKIVNDYPSWEARNERDRERERQEDQWLAERRLKLEARRQRDLLRQGHETLKQIRRVLRGADPSPRQASRPEKTSRT